jgi:hypothetical protein
MNRFNSLRVPALVLGVLVLGAISAAQGGGGQGRARGFGGGFGGGRSNSMFLLRRTDVQTDLQLTTDQKTKLDDLMTSMRGNRGQGGGNRGQGGGNRGANGGNGGNGGQGDGTPPTDAERQARRADMESRRAEQQKQVNAILTPAQITRLGEISIQTRGNMAIMDPEIRKQIDFSSDQTAKVKALQDKMQEAMQSVFQKSQDGTITRDDAMKSMQKNGEVMKTELGKILTHRQADKLKELGGSPFKEDPSEAQGFGRGFGGGGGRGGRRGGGGGGGGL